MSKAKWVEMKFYYFYCPKCESKHTSLDKYEMVKCPYCYEEIDLSE